MSTIVVTEDVTGPAYDDLSARRSLCRDAEAWESPDRWPTLMRDAEALIVRNRTRVDSRLLESAPRLKVIARAGVGLDNIDVGAADDAGVVVVAPLGANAVSVAEHAVTMALALSKGLISADHSTRAGTWARTPTQELCGRRWGLLSAGATARATARLARGLGMTVAAYDPYIDENHPEIVDLGIEMLSLSDVLETSQVLSVHLPNTEATRNLLDAAKLALLPEGAYLINVGRGEVVDEEALADAIESGRLGGAGLDVRQQEPPTLGRLEKLANVIVTPHVAGITSQAQERIARILCEQIDLVLSGSAATSAVGNHTIPKLVAAQ